MARIKEILIEGHKKSSPSSKKSFANAVNGESGGSLDSQLMGWRCRVCGSWDVSAAVIGEGQHGGCNV